MIRSAPPSPPELPTPLESHFLEPLPELDVPRSAVTDSHQTVLELFSRSTQNLPDLQVAINEDPKIESLKKPISEIKVPDIFMERPRETLGDFSSVARPLSKVQVEEEPPRAPVITPVLNELGFLVYPDLEETKEPEAPVSIHISDWRVGLLAALGLSEEPKVDESYLDELPEGITLRDSLGRGGFGQVFCCEFKTKTVCYSFFFFSFFLLIYF